MRKTYWGVCWFILFPALVAQAEVSTPIEQQVLQAKEVLPETPSTWQGTVTSQFSDIGTVQNGYGNGGYYYFRDAQVSNEAFAGDYRLNTVWSAEARMQYLTKYFDEMAGSLHEIQRAQGMGDTFIGTVYNVPTNSRLAITVTGGVLAPTGSTNEVNPYSGKHYCYRMQLGSGTWDPSLTVKSVFTQPDYAIGLQLASIVRTGFNSDGYRLGNQYRADANFDYPLKYGFTPRFTGYYRVISTVHGYDDTVTWASTEYYQSTQTDWRVAAALRYDHAFSRSVSAGIEGGIPLAQYMLNNDHIVMNTHFYGNMSIVGAF